MKLYLTPRTAAALLLMAIPLACQNLSGAAGTSAPESSAGTASTATLGNPLHTLDQVQAIVAQFQGTNEKLGKPRYLIAVTHERMSSSPPTVADRNRTHEVEKWTQQLFTAAGATLVDPNVGVPLLASKPYHRIPAADKASSKRERDALSKVTDVVVEVTIVVRHVKVQTSANETVYVVPDVSAEAYRVTDSALLGAASTEDVIKSRKLPEDTIMAININDRTETTIIALMEDMKRNLH